LLPFLKIKKRLKKNLIRIFPDLCQKLRKDLKIKRKKKERKKENRKRDLRIPF
jgi:hypothetical protein